MSTRLRVAWEEGAVAPIRIQSNPSARILVVDDDLDIRQLSADVLVRSGFAVDAAADGLAGWEALRVHNYDLLITDHNLPRLTGLELVQKLRSARMALPVILASGTLPLQEPQWHPGLQLAAILPKPFSPDQLLKTVKEVLRV